MLGSSVVATEEDWELLNRARQIISRAAYHISSTFRDDPLSGKLNWGAEGGQAQNGGGHDPLDPLGTAPDDDDESSTTNGAKVDVFVEQ